MKKTSPPGLAIVAAVLAAIVGILYVRGGVALIIAGASFTAPVFGVMGSLFLVLGILDILTGVKFYRGDPWSWTLAGVSSALSGFAIFLSFRGDGGVTFLPTIPSELGDLRDYFSAGNRILLHPV